MSQDKSLQKQEEISLYEAVLNRAVKLSNKGDFVAINGKDGDNKGWCLKNPFQPSN